ncbi:MAG: hypothetical protein RBS55_07980 [Bacteroidales bacterium]|jgi:hypothetical protein|nr:hypothetical protein [Bacteroidales bacterium]
MGDRLTSCYNNPCPTGKGIGRQSALQQSMPYGQGDWPAERFYNNPCPTGKGLILTLVFYRVWVTG